MSRSALATDWSAFGVPPLETVAPGIGTTLTFTKLLFADPGVRA